jgi:hypothetical protein
VAEGGWEERGAGVSRRRQFYENDDVVLVDDDDGRLDESNEMTAASKIALIR